MHSRATSDSYQSALGFLLGRIDYERTAAGDYGPADLRLEPMRELLERLGDPLADLRVIHVAGTKGKGSTAAMIASMLTSAGYRTGLYSSPHLYRVEERMAVDARIASAAEFVSLVQAVQPHVEAMDAAGGRTPGGRGPTYFDLTTAMALLHFRRKRANAAVLEVGLGGRLDSTNVCLPLVSVITSISLDHTKQLGDTLAAIAGEKAGIVKPGVPVVSGVTPPEPRDVIRRIADERRAPLIELERDFTFDYEPPRGLQKSPALGLVTYRRAASGTRFDKLAMAPPGRHQAANAAIALATVELLRERGWSVPDAAIRQGLVGVRCPARVEVISRRPLVVLDAAHNEASARALVESLTECFDAARRVLVFATTLDKDYRAMLRILLPACDEVILTRYQSNPRGVPVDDLAAVCRELGHDFRTAPDAPSAWGMARASAAPGDMICIAGSFYLASEMRAAIAARDSAAREQGNRSA